MSHSNHRKVAKDSHTRPAPRMQLVQTTVGKFKQPDNDQDILCNFPSDFSFSEPDIPEELPSSRA